MLMLKKQFKYSSYILLILIVVIGSSFSNGFFFDDDDYANDNFIRYDDFTYNDSIKTVLLYNYKSQLLPPIIPLSGKEHLILSFDDLQSDFKEYNYTVVHCNANWTPSDLEPNEYIQGFFEDNITDYRLSFNTDLSYNHYKIEFPNENMQINKSGNYIVKVFEEGDNEKPILTKRFMVFENNITINMRSKRATDVNDQFFKQEIDFSLKHSGYKILDPFRSLNVVLMQNYRWDNAIISLQPKFVKDDELDYNYDRENVFDGGSEFREFDIKSIKYQTIRIKHIEYSNIDRLTHVYILPDENRSYKRYYSSPDINGNFLVKRNEGDDSDIEADYVKVHFTLPNVMPLDTGNLYLFGKFSDWKFKDKFKLDYDTLKSTYYKEVLLKQGFYNYQYCFVKDGSKNTGDLTVIEGTHSETENNYSILVYHRPANESYDKIIGYHTISSSNR
jgi:type 9 secretion system plug protein